MKNKKLLIILTTFCVLLSLCSLSALAAEYTSDVVVSLQIDNPIMEVNGVEAEIDAGRGTKPVVIQGRTVVPIRAIIESFGGTVGWDGETQSVTLSMNDDNIKLVINSNTAYLNGEEHTLDVAPVVINERTMLPIRFIAEGFNLGVAWEGNTQTVSIIRNLFDEQEYQYLMSVVPTYSGNPYVTVNNNVPLFKDYEKIAGSFEYYSDLDELGRCDVTMASIAKDIMPTEDRESISEITPTGWVNKKYDTISGGYLYNRCHLIGYQLTGENANERNLITGTKYLNINGMLPFENQVDDYIEQTNNHVMYRVTPVFTANNLVADGVLLEAYSVEDNGVGLSFCVYCYNTQPNIVIDYTTGNSYQSETIVDTPVSPSVPTAPTTPETPTQSETEIVGSKVYRTPSGKKYHYDAECGGKNSYETTLEEATSAGLTPCSKCAQ